MNAEEMAQLLTAEPFVPFRVCLSDGSSYEIKHPEFVLLARNVMDIGIPPDPNHKIADQIVRCSYLHIVKVETLVAT